MNWIYIIEKNQTNIRNHDTKTYQIFVLLIDNVKIRENIVFQPVAPVLYFHQNKSNICCLSSLAWTFHSIGDNRDVPDIVNRTEESLTL